MKKIVYISITAILLFSLSCESMKKKPAEFIIETTYGDIYLKLYENTPKHKTNFMRLVNSDYYNDLIFHRVIDNFMIQSGDPDSKNAKKGTILGSGGPDYTIKAEIREEYFHKKGVIAAARKGNEINPEKRSSGSQFYIVLGKIFSVQQLDNLENRINHGRKNQVIGDYISQRPELKHKIEKLQKAEEFTALDSVLHEITIKIRNDSIGLEEYSIPDNRRKIYTTIGGTPALDGEYTVFGELTKGLEIVEKISKLPTDKNDRPLKDVIINIKQIQ